MDVKGSRITDLAVCKWTMLVHQNGARYILVVCVSVNCLLEDTLQQPSAADDFVTARFVAAYALGRAGTGALCRAGDVAV